MSGYSNKKFYILSESSGRGFFAMFRTVLENLQHCEEEGYSLIPDWTNTGYSDEAHGYNAWDYYFESLSGHRLEEAEFLKAKEGNNGLTQVRWDNSQFRLKPLRINGRTLTKRETYNYYITKYIKIRPRITEKVNDFYNRCMRNRNVLGVHIRRTDKYFCSSVPAGGSPVSDKKFTENINKYLQKYPACKKFIATDCQNTFEAMKVLYGDKIIAWDSIRSKDGTSVHQGILGKELKGFSNYKKGEDALIDCLLLSRCNFLIRSISSLSTTSLCFNTDLKQLDLNWIYNNCKIDDWIENTIL